MAPDAQGGVLMDVQAAAGDFLLLHYLRDVVDELEVCPLFASASDAARVKVPLPGKGALFASRGWTDGWMVLVMEGAPALAYA